MTMRVINDDPNVLLIELKQQQAKVWIKNDDGHAVVRFSVDGMPTKEWTLHVGETITLTGVCNMDVDSGGVRLDVTDGRKP